MSYRLPQVCRRLFSRAPSALVLLITAACGGSAGDVTGNTPTATPGPPVSLAIVYAESTYSQTATQTAGFAVEQVVRVLDSQGRSVPNIPVTFGIGLPGAGTLNGAQQEVTVTSNADGLAILPAGTWAAPLLPNALIHLNAALPQKPTGAQFTHIRVDNSYGQTSCELAKSGTVYCTGRNANGAIGDATQVDRLTFVAVTGSQKYALLAEGVANHHCALNASGAAYCWGQNTMGELGDGTFIDRSSPVPVTGNLAFTALYTQLSTTCGITASNVTYCWGFTGTGGWGAGNAQRAQRYSTPTQVTTGGLTFRKLALLDDGLCGITASGTIACLARGYQGGNNDGTNTQRTTFATWQGTWSDVAAANTNICALDATGAAWCVGSDQGGALGAALGGTATYYLSAQKVATTVTFTSITVGNFRACGITAANDAYCWGFYPGDGTVNVDRPVKIPGFTTTRVRFMSFRNPCAKALDLRLYCWGNNTSATVGTVGDGTFIDRLTPTLVAGWPQGG